jgi:Protein of unknown function (DUF1097)
LGYSPHPEAESVSHKNGLQSLSRWTAGIGAIATWLFLGPFGGALAIWAAFIAWGCFFHCGGKEHGLQSAIVNNVAGAVIAGITLWVATQTGIADKLGVPLWAAICVGIGVAAMVLLANIPAFDSIPAQVYGFASVVAYVLMKDAAGSLTAASLQNPEAVIILSMIIGAVFGYVSEKLAGMLAGMGSHAHHAKA